MTSRAKILLSSLPEIVRNEWATNYQEAEMKGKRMRNRDPPPGAAPNPEVIPEEGLK